MSTTDEFKTTWKDACNGDEALIAYLNSTVVRDEFYPRIPDADDIQNGRDALASRNGQSTSFFPQGTVYPAAPDGLKL